MIRPSRVILALVCVWIGMADAAESSLCDKLAKEARRLPASAWANPGAEPLGAWLKRPDGQTTPGQLSVAEEALAADPRWRERVFAFEGEQVDVSRLPGTPVYMISRWAGTANCQALVLIEMRSGEPLRELEPPFKVDGMELCVTQAAQFAEVLGRKALVASGTVSGSNPNREYRISPWTGRGWGRACGLQLHMRTAIATGQRFCAPGAAVCESGQRVADQLAKAYEADRAADRPLDHALFTFGRSPDAAATLALMSPPTDSGAMGEKNLDLPVFGADVRRLGAMNTTFSNNDPRRLPVFIDDQWWLAVVGRGGVGWREGNSILVALFAPPGRSRNAVASYQFITGTTGLQKAVVRDNLP